MQKQTRRRYVPRPLGTRVLGKTEAEYLRWHLFGVEPK